MRLGKGRQIMRLKIEKLVYGGAGLARTEQGVVFVPRSAPGEMQRLGLSWSLRLTGEFGYVLALLVGLAIANLMPVAAQWLAEAARAELFIKTAIVILGGTVGVKAAEQLGLASSIMWRGLAAIIEAGSVEWAHKRASISRFYEGSSAGDLLQKIQPAHV